MKAEKPWHRPPTGGGSKASVIAFKSPSLIAETRLLVVGQEALVLSALGIPRPKRGWHIHCPLPTHSDKNPSFRFDETVGRYFCSCGSGDLLDLVQWLGCAHDVVSACNWVRELLGHPRIGSTGAETESEKAARGARIAGLLAQAADLERKRNEDREAYRLRQLDKAANMLRRSAPAAGTIAQKYLTSRGITCKLHSNIRFLPPSSPGQRPCMVVPFGFSDNQLGGVHLTFLRPDGSGKGQDENDKSKIIVGIDHSYPLVVAPSVAGASLLITEGIEEALSGHQALRMGAWAAGTASLLPGLAEHVPANVKSVIIRQDPDPSGEVNSERLADALHSRGLPVFISRGL